MSSPQARPFLDLLAEINKGRTHHELTDQLAEVTQRCIETGKKGSITVKLTIEPDKADDGTVRIYDDVQVKAPRPDRKPSLFFATDGYLSRENPQQRTFESLKEVPPLPETTTLKKAENE